MIRRGLVFASMVTIALGVWMIASGFNGTGTSAVQAGESLAPVPVQTGNPVLLGTLLMAAGVVFIVIVSRRR
jgi:hypothetical protein